MKIPASLEQYCKDFGLTLVSPYEGNSKAVLWRCAKGHEFEVTWRYLQKKPGAKGCVVCNSAQKIPYRQVKELIESDNQHELKTLEKDYKNATSDLEIHCRKHDATFPKSYKAFKSHGCSLCRPKNKFTLENVVAYASGEGYTVHSTSFKSCKDHVDIECPFGHRYPVKWSAFYHLGRRCKCMKSKNFFKKLQSKALERGYVVPDQNYIDAVTPIQMICPEGHDMKMSWSHFHVRGQNCGKCDPHQKYTYEFVKELVEQYDFTLRSDEYVDNKDLLHLRCSGDHDWHVSFGSLMKRHRESKEIKCPYCEGQRVYSIEECVEEAAGKNITLLDFEFKTSSTKMNWICPKGHRYESTWKSFKAGHGCPTCGNAEKHQLDNLKTKAQEHGYAILSTEYVNNKTKLDFKCPEGHQFPMRWNDFNTGYRCPTCWLDSQMPNLMEQEIGDFVAGLGFEVSLLNRTLLNGKELDVYVPEKKFAIEHCGIYWHSEEILRDKKAHLNKYRLCREAGITLITLFEDEWIHKKDIVMNILKAKLGKSEHRIFARNCIVKEVPKEEAKSFLNENHLQGHARGRAFGLYHENTLVQLMSFYKHHRQNAEQGVLVLNRMCTRGNCNVIGGASRLLKHSLAALKPKKVVTFADLRWSEGDLYRKLGFHEDAVLDPDYSYVKTSERRRYSKQSLKKTKAERLTGETELQLRTAQGYKRIWDCGKIRFSLE